MPYAQATQSFEARHTYIVNVEDVANHIQLLLEGVLNPPEKGLYLPNQVDPILRQGRDYWYQQPVFVNMAQQQVAVREEEQRYPSPYYHGEVLKQHSQPWQYYRYNYIHVDNFEQVMTTPFDIVEMEHGFIPPYYNQHDEFPGSDKQPRCVILPRYLASQGLLVPNVSVAGIKIAQLMIDNEVNGSRAYQHIRMKTIEEIVLPFLNPQYLSTPTNPRQQSLASVQLDFLRSDTWFQRVLSGVFDSMLTIVAPIRAMLRENPYEILTVNYREGYDIHIERLGDYRIQEWERTMQDPNYQRFLRARSDGTWDRFVAEHDEARSVPTLEDLNKMYVRP